MTTVSLMTVSRRPRRKIGCDGSMVNNKQREEQREPGWHWAGFQPGTSN